MSTTNPPGAPIPPGNAPGAGPNWPNDATNLAAPDDSGGGGGVNPEALRLKHEPDVFAVKPILSVPFAVVVTFVVAFGVAAAVFAYVSAQAAKPTPFSHPQAVARGSAPLNDRLARTSQKGTDGVKSEVDQPRLETLRRLEGNDKEKGVQVTTQMELKTGNAPWIHPEDIRPDRVPGLNRTEFADKDKKTARIPIDEAMKLVVSQKMLPVQAGATRPQSSTDKATGANAGRGGLPALPKQEAAPKAPEPAPMPKAPEKK